MDVRARSGTLAQLARLAVLRLNRFTIIHYNDYNVKSTGIFCSRMNVLYFKHLTYIHMKINYRHLDLRCISVILD